MQACRQAARGLSLGVASHPEVTYSTRRMGAVTVWCLMRGLCISLTNADTSLLSRASTVGSTDS